MGTFQPTSADGLRGIALTCAGAAGPQRAPHSMLPNEFTANAATSATAASTAIHCAYRRERERSLKDVMCSPLVETCATGRVSNPPRAHAERSRNYIGVYRGGPEGRPHIRRWLKAPFDATYPPLQRDVDAETFLRVLHTIRDLRPLWAKLGTTSLVSTSRDACSARRFGTLIAIVMLRDTCTYAPRPALRAARADFGADAVYLRLVGDRGAGAERRIALPGFSRSRRRSERSRRVIPFLALVGWFLWFRPRLDCYTSATRCTSVRAIARISGRTRVRARCGSCMYASSALDGNCNRCISSGASSAPSVRRVPTHARRGPRRVATPCLRT